VAFFSEVVQVFGVPKSLGQIYGLLYATPEPLSFSDIVERLEISKGSASQGLQLLRSLGAIKVADRERQADGDSRKTGETKVWALTLNAGDATRSARIAYEPELSLRRLVSGVLQERITPLATAGADRLERLRGLAEEPGDGNDFYLERVGQLNTWRRQLKTVLPMLSILLGPKSKKLAGKW
jgi:HTH-type transcriptional regulator, glycine betaine synthesis regulator